MTNKKLNELRAKREDSRLKAMAIIDKAEKEARFFTEDEQKEIDKLDEEIRAMDSDIMRIEKVLAIKPEEARTDDVDDPEDVIDGKTPANDKKAFRTLGEQMMAVYRSSAPGGQIDARLSTRAASGLNETNPSDGGFLVQQDFVKTLLKRTYETGILASRVRRIPISSNSNGLKINAIDEDSRANGSRWGGVQTYWQGEADQLTGSKPKFKQMELSL